MDLSERIRQAGGNVLPVARRRGLLWYFDYRGAQVEVPGGDADLSTGIRRIAYRLIERLPTGLRMLTAAASHLQERLGGLQVHLARTGKLNGRVVSTEIVGRVRTPLASSTAATSLPISGQVGGI